MVAPVGPIRSLLRVLGVPGRRWLAVASAAQVLERVAVAAATIFVIREGTDHAVLLAMALGGVFLIRTALRSRLRVVARARVLEVVTAALVSESAGLAQASDRDAELGLVDGLYAAEDLLGQRLPELVGDGPACVGLAALMAWVEPSPIVAEAGVAVGIGACVAVLARKVTAASAERLWRAFVPALEDLSTAIHGRLEIATNGAREAFLRRVAAKVALWEERSVRTAWSSFLAGRAPVVGAVAAVGILFVLQGGWNPEKLAAAAVFLSVAPAFAGVARGAIDLRRDLVRAGPIVRCLEEVREAPRGGSASVVLPAAIEWSGISFRYSGQATALLGHVAVSWRPGVLLGLAGQNGSGKSTFLHLLLGLQQPTRGAVCIGETSLRDLDLAVFRRSVAYLAQRPFLPDRMTVSQAIFLIAPDAAPDAIEATLTRLALWPVLVRRAERAPLDVKLGALSAGEKQRVAIARVLLRDAPLLLLDEPDANLDAEGVALVGDVLREESRKRMVVFAAHDPLLLARADRLVSFEGGRASEQPRHSSTTAGQGPVAPTA
jgi:ATP-binding cassette subfamily C protein CydD